MKSDIEIAQEAKMKPIADIAASLGLADEDVIPYGRYKAKVNHRLIHKASKQGKLILVTAISPTPAGEGKTTTSVGLADAMNAIGKKTMLCLREPSLGPVFGMKGGAAGGGYAQVVPMEDINLLASCRTTAKEKKPSYSRHIRAPILNRRLLRKSRPPVLFAYQSVSSSVWRP